MPTIATRPDKHLLNHDIHSSNQLFTHVEPAQPAIEFIVLSSINPANALQSLSGSASASSASAAPISAISISGSIGTSKSQSSSTSSQTTAVGATVAAGKKLTITANGDKSQGAGNITTVGATLSAGKEATLQATGDINLLASQNTAASRSTNSSSNASIGATLALGGAQNGLSFQAGAQGSKGKANGAEVTYNNTTITVGSTDKDGKATPGTLNLKSGGNTTLRGATASADTVNADIAGNLTIESLQDQSTYDSKQTSAGAGVSICIPPICYGTMVAINVNAGKTKINGDHLSVGVVSSPRQPACLLALHADTVQISCFVIFKSTCQFKLAGFLRLLFWRLETLHADHAIASVADSPVLRNHHLEVKTPHSPSIYYLNSYEICSDCLA